MKNASVSRRHFLSMAVATLVTKRVPDPTRGAWGLFEPLPPPIDPDSVPSVPWRNYTYTYTFVPRGDLIELWRQAVKNKLIKPLEVPRDV